MRRGAAGLLRLPLIGGGAEVCRSGLLGLDSIRARPPALGTLPGGGVSERPKERASKAREVKASAGSNPAATASWLGETSIPSLR